MSAKTMKWYGERKMNKSRMMEFAESLKIMQEQKKKLLTKFKAERFAKSKKFRTFAKDDEPSAFATDVGKGIPTLTGKSAQLFLERAAKVEAEAKRRMNEPPTLESLERELKFQKFFLESDKRVVEEREEKIKKLEEKIKEIKNGKTEEE